MTVALDGALSVVTGGASGIGRALALEVASGGARVVVADRDGDGAQRVVDELRVGGAEAWAAPLDVTDAEACERLATNVARDHGQVDLVCANAGIIRPGSSWTTSRETWRAVLDVNVMGVVHTLEAFLPEMTRGSRPAHVLLTASVAGLTGSPGFAAYGAAKHAVVGLAKGLRVELAEAGAAHVGVSVLCPGGVATDIWRSAGVAPVDLDPVARVRFDKVGGVRTDQADPAVVARLAVEAVREDRFWIVPIEAHHRDELARLDRAVEKRAAGDGPLAFGR